MSAILAFYVSTLLLLAPLLACVGVGTYWGKRSLPFSPNFLSMLVTSVSTPALVFHTLTSTELENQVLMEIGSVTALALFLSAVLCALALRISGLPVRALVQTAAFPNAGNMGLPLAYLAFGAQGFSAAIVFFAICAFVQNTIAVRLLPGAGVKGAWKAPVLVASVAAVACRVLDLSVPQWIMESAQLLGSLTVPLMLISLGYALSSIPAKGLRSGATVATLRLVIGALAGFSAGWVLGLDAGMRGLITLQMTMPCAVMSYIFATRYTDQGDVSAGAVLLSTVGFIALSPLILAMVGAPLPGATP